MLTGTSVSKPLTDRLASSPVSSAGRDQLGDPERLQRLSDTAPDGNLDKVMRPGWRDRE
ncbi:MAG: hypothetical protein ACU0B9_11270 [Limimaricola soesokkakensis]|uniref:hypothetical protein n=1 Tax=Limimaricola soesokkakensis TaxID=1343159 RepID=UPI004059DE3F